MAQTPYHTAIRAEIQRIEAGLASPGFLSAKTRSDHVKTIIARELQLQGHRVDISGIYVTTEGLNDPVLTNGDQLAKRAFWLFGVEIRRMPF